MIEYRLLTRPQVMQWRREHSFEVQDSRADTPRGHIVRRGVQSDTASPVLGLSRCVQEVDDDAVVAICAFDDDRLIGRLSIVYFELLVNGQYRRCAVGSGFKVLEEYRKGAPGLSILLKAMHLGMPYFETSVSGQMREILLRMKPFTLVDDSPVYQAGLNRAGIIQLARWDFFKNPDTGNRVLEQFSKLKLLANHWRHSRKLLNADPGTYTLKTGSGAMAVLEKDFAVAGFRVQLPWSREFIGRGLSGEDAGFRAWLISFDSNPGKPWLISLYLRERVLGHGPQGEPNVLREAHLNEIYPPLQSGDPVLALLSFASRQAKATGTSVLHIHALTEAMESTCRNIGLKSATARTVFVAPGNSDPELRDSLLERDNWWCRAFSEEELEEAFSAGNGTDDLLP